MFALYRASGVVSTCTAGSDVTRPSVCVRGLPAGLAL